MHFHKWSPWKEFARGDLFKYLDSKDLTKKIHVGMVSYQERTCSGCGLKRLFCDTARINPSYELQTVHTEGATSLPTNA